MGPYLPRRGSTLFVLFVSCLFFFVFDEGLQPRQLMVNSLSALDQQQDESEEDEPGGGITVEEKRLIDSVHVSFLNCV